MQNINKKLFILIFLFLLPIESSAEVNFQLSLGTGASLLLSNSQETVVPQWPFVLDVGILVNRRLSFSLECQLHIVYYDYEDYYRKHGFNWSELYSSLIFRYFFLPNKKVDPFILLGLGLGLTNYSIKDDGNICSGITEYQFGGGIGYNMTENIRIDLATRMRYGPEVWCKSDKAGYTGVTLSFFIALAFLF